MKRKILILLGLMILVGGVLFACTTYPAGCRRLAADSSRNAATLWHRLNQASSNGKWDRVLPSLQKLGSDALHDLTYIDAPASALRAGAEAATDAETQDDVAAPPAWQAPAVVPAKPGWTWTTKSGAEYSNVKVVGMEQDAVAIVFSGGGKRIPVIELTPEVQRELGYDPARYAPATSPGNTVSAAAQKEAQQRLASSGKWEYDDYNAAQVQARATGKHMLLYFTGSDWCPWCQKMDSEILSSSEFRRFASLNFIMVTVDFPHNKAQSDLLKKLNASLAQTYHVTGYPMLVAIDAAGKMLATSSYDPAIDAVIGNLAPARIARNMN